MTSHGVRSMTAYSSLIRIIWSLVFPAIVVMSDIAHASDLGASVENIASVSYQQGTSRVSTATAPAIFTIEARRTPSTIEFFRIVRAAPDGFETVLNGSNFLTNGTFSPVTPIRKLGGAPVDVSRPVTLVSADSFFPGEPIVISVTDAGQNGDPNVIERVEATIETAAGDMVHLQLFESGPDTGVFLAFIQSTADPLLAGDDFLTIATGTTLTARYQDPFDATEISVDLAGVDPFGRVFDSATGTLLDGVRVTIVDAETGAPAPVFGLDGVSAYPSTVITGEIVTDASGVSYPLAAGQFRFPIMFPGTYRIIVEPPAGYTGPSGEPESALQALPGAPFEISLASFGAPFVLDGTGDVAVDIPLDPSSEIVVTKSALAQSAAIGDFVRYEVTAENRGSNAVRLRFEDILPKGFRYQSGSAALSGIAIADPAIAGNGRSLAFEGAALAAGESARLTYVALVGPNAVPGEAVNTARAIDGQGSVLSNTAEAAILIEDSFLRSTLNIIGRVAAGACDPASDWPRKIAGGDGLAGIRLYTETGVSTLTDADGLYHFEALTPGLHVVQIDETTVPRGYDIVQCEETTRFAGRATSQFVEGRGGALLRANFYLARNGDEVAPLAADAVDPDAVTGDDSDLTEYLAFDADWLNGQAPATRWAYPQAGTTPSVPSVNAGFLHAPHERVSLVVNGTPVPGYNFGGRDFSADRKKALTRWRGIDLLPGDNRLMAIVTDSDGREIKRIGKTISYIDRVERLIFDPSTSYLIADGRKEPVIALRASDGAGRPVRAGRMVSVTIDAPYRAADLREFEDINPIDQPLSNVASYPVSRDGLVRVRLAPTTQTGNVTIRARIDTGADIAFSAYLTPALRDWIVVGLAEGSVARTKTTASDRATVTARDTLRDGRAAVFAKGAVKGDWLITLAGDTDQRRGDIDDELFDVVDPDDRFALYGDRSQQQFEAQSRYPVYLKAEKEAFQAEIGDFDVGLNSSRLARYPRRLTGGRVVYEGERIRFNGFASDTSQTFAREELAADGTSGPFRLNGGAIVRNSETIILETRDRFRPDIILATTPLTRFVDYDIDFNTGEFILRLPAPATDDAFNNNVIVVEYEAVTPVERGVTAGGRAGLRLADGRAEVGVSLIRENAPDANGNAGDARLLVGLDVEAQLTQTTRARFEIAETHRPDPTGNEAGDQTAILAEIEHVSQDLQASLVYQETGTQFGLGQVSSAIAGVRRYGGEARYRFQEFVNQTGNQTGNQRGERFVTAEAYREESLATGARRDVAAIAVSQESRETAVSAGLRYVGEEPVGEARRETLLATASARQTVDHVGLTLRASRDQPIVGDRASTQFPARTTLGFDQRIVDAVTLNVTHEIQDGAAARNANTIVGITANPWTGNAITLSADRLTQDSGERIGATLGVDQQVRLDDHWSASFGLTRRENLRDDGDITLIDTIVPDSPVSPFDTAGAFTSIFTGLAYRDDVATGSGRFELRKSADGQRYTFVAGAAREVSEQLSFAGAARLTQENNDLTADRRTGDARFAAAWRPRDSEALVILNRLDVALDEVDGDARNTRIVNNLALNVQATERLQLNANHGLKYAILETGEQTFGNWTQLVGAEARYDVKPWLDLGVQGSALYDHGSGAVQYAYGPSVGIAPATNVWFTLGYNVEGFEDPDFAAAEWTRAGPYLRLRVKFDQHNLRGFLDRISPDRAR